MKKTIKELRENEGWSQTVLAEKLKTTQPMICWLEKGKYKPSLKMALKIAGVFGVKVEDIQL